MDKRKLTAENGRPIADNQNIQTAGERGPVLLQDPWYTEKIAHFDREVIPERRMHAKGHLHSHKRHYRIYPRVHILRRRQKD